MRANVTAVAHVQVTRQKHVDVTLLHLVECAAGPVDNPVNPLARRVKIADLEDNMDVRRRKKITQKDKKKLAQYLSAWHRLHDTKH